jgi:aspartate aminotransferase
MDFLNSCGLSLKPSETLAVKSLANRLKKEGREIIDLSTGEPDIDTPDHIKNGALQALKDGKTKYTEVAGILELREAIARKLREEDHIPAVNASSICVTNGGKQALLQLILVTVRPGDKVLLLAPYWVSYPAMIELAGGIPVVVTTTLENGYKVTPTQLKAALTADIRAVIINSPSNPTGSAYTREELIELASVIKDSEAFVISDEIYEKIVYRGFKATSFAAAAPEMAERVFTVNGFSKAYSMTGWRVGYVHGKDYVIQAVTRYQSQSSSNICSIAQYAALAALTGAHDFIQPMLNNFERRYQLAIKNLSQVAGLKFLEKPQGAFYLFANFEVYKERFTSGSNFTAALLEATGVAAVPGEAFGDPYAFRISVAASDKMVGEGTKRIAQLFRLT